MTHYTRRTLLAAAGSLTAGLAGCLSLGSETNGSASTSNGTNGSGAIQAARIEGTTLVIELRPETTVDRLTVIDPSGAAFADRTVTTGATRVSVEIGTRYTPGEYRIHAVRDDEQIATTALEIAPEIEILDVRVGANHMDEMPDSLGNSRKVEAIATVLNSGTGPAAIAGLLFGGGVPNPSERGKIQSEARRSGIYNLEAGGDVEELVLLSGKKETLYSTTLPFSWAQTSGGCRPGDGSITVSVLYSHGQREARWVGNVSYSEGADRYECKTTLTEAD
ncbi:hypothetical protein ACFPYI_19195 [Halomarina salina]|uniref:Uncharacterized protein n=1 Tax=Halomarina salina TaxID=1872699 RepID=A0ABD5RS88_9EURY|nr:hypothetical protein [Halomarina salina]